MTTIEKCISGIAVAVWMSSCTTAPAPEPVAVQAGLPLSIEGENPVSEVGIVRNRAAARRGKTLWLRAGQQAEYRVRVDTAGSYALALHYSNDAGSSISEGRADFLIVSVNGTAMPPPIVTVNTRPPGAEAGAGWNEFVTSDWVRLGKLNPGIHTIALLVDDADDFGVEIDRIEIRVAE